MVKGTIHAVCLSEKKGTPKQNRGAGRLVACSGLAGDAHAGNWHRQVSLLSLEQINAFRARGANVEFGAFGENIVADGIDFRALPVGSVLKIIPEAGGKDTGDSAELVITQIGKECHQHCAIFETVGDCIMPREGVFAVVTRGGTVKTGDSIHVE